MSGRNETCENFIILFWVVEDHWQFSPPISDLCHIDIVVDEWLSSNFTLNIVDMVRLIIYTKEHNRQHCSLKLCK